MEESGLIHLEKVQRRLEECWDTVKFVAYSGWLRTPVLNHITLDLAQLCNIEALRLKPSCDASHNLFSNFFYFLLF